MTRISLGPESISVVFFAASLALSHSTGAATVIIDSFDHGSTMVELPVGGWPREISGATYDPGINDQLPGSDNTRYWRVFAHETSSSYMYIPPDGYADLLEWSAGGWSLAYRYATPTDLTRFTTLNVLGVGGGYEIEPLEWQIGFIDNDGDVWGAETEVVISWPANIYVDLDNLQLIRLGGDGVLNRAEITEIYLRGYCPGPARYIISEISLSPASIEQLLTALYESVVGVGPGRSLANKILHAQSYYAAHDLGATCAMLAAFVNEVEAQTGKKIEVGLATKLIDDASYIRKTIGCRK